MSTIQLKDFASAEHSLNGQEYAFISQNDKTRKVDLDTLKKFIVGTGTLLTSDQSSIINAINELQQDILNQSGGTGVLQTEIDNIKKDYISKTKDLLNSYQVGTIETNLIPTVQALTDVYDLLNGMIITINSNIGDKSKLGTIDTTNLVNAINEINNGLKNIEIVTQELDNLIGGTFDVSTEGSLVDKIGNLKTMIETNKPIWDDKYTKAEIDNKISQLITNLDWKESVTTFDDIATTYPTPEDGWTVNVKDTDITYRYNGTTWIDISANAIPLATSTVDGKMSKQDKIDHDDMVTKRHIHTNKSVLDGITSALITAWNSAVTHISDTVKHITSAERNLWNTVSNKSDKGHKHTKSEITDMPTQVSQFENDAGYITQADVDTSQNHTHTNKSVLDGITSDKVNSWDNKLSLSGGKVTGKTKFSQGTNVAYMATTTISGIYKHVAKITVRQNYQNQPITLDIIQRARFGTVIIEFKNSNTNDPELRRFTKIGELEAYLYKSATSTWELYIKMTEQYDCIDIMEFNKGEYMNLVDVTWTADTVTDLPTGYIKADRAYIDMTVERSVRDTDGNQINTTYVKKGVTWDELEGKA
jgi:hypothetical protein|nr:MAG TPA: Protein of unknown function (DUF2793) [Caudoviricetes sp.]